MEMEAKQLVRANDTKIVTVHDASIDAEVVAIRQTHAAEISILKEKYDREVGAALA
jgi:hypothetical protein